MHFNFQANYKTEIIFDKFSPSESDGLIFADEFFKSKFGDNEKIIYLQSGEGIKNKNHLLEVLDICEAKKITKKCKITAVGGGAILDFVGFVASIINRGVELVNVPTTLLAMVDSTLGGKTGINSSLGKNTIGAFYPAHKIIIDEDFLKTLPQREINSGMAEVIKCELISGVDLSNMSGCDLIKKCLEIKAHFCEDLLDKNKRKFLNYGHTYGHALEAIMPSKYTHGEAVGLGMLFVAKLNNDKELYKITKNKLLKNSLPVNLPELDEQEFLQQVKLDKKNTSQNLSFVVLKKIGEPVVKEFDEAEVLSALNLQYTQNYL